MTCSNSRNGSKQKEVQNIILLEQNYHEEVFFNTFRALLSIVSGDEANRRKIH